MLSNFIIKCLHIFECKSFENLQNWRNAFPFWPATDVHTSTGVDNQKTKTRYILNAEAFMALYFSQSIPSRYTNYITETMVKERKTVKEWFFKKSSNPTRACL